MHAGLHRRFVLRMQWLKSENYLEEGLSQQVAAFMHLSMDPQLHNLRGSDPQGV